MAMADLLLALLGGAPLARRDLAGGITRLTGQTRPRQVERCLLGLRAGGFVAVHASSGRSHLFELTATGRARALCWLTRPGGCRALEPRALAARALLEAWPRGERGALWRREESSRRRRLLAARAGPDTRPDVTARLRLARLRRTLKAELAFLAELEGDPACAALRPPRPAVRGSR